MNATSQALRAYSPAAATAVRTGRSIEHQLFSQITSRLRDAAASGNFPKLAAALHDNRRLWTVLAADVADDDNALPATLRAQIFYLAEFTAHHTARILTEGATPTPLIEINCAIMAGLSGEGGAK
ncbi:MAG: flagellar biosynthesis regulator FlaF [Limimaricola sp.]|uniref:flagellar biosynthesis regulator FlaF n=1 Tax=Limimaricola sp. TaxID=2211665 RepID=UPI001D680C40|nr:flagellar biosynthesis regulator FlaF [Limimaricola sp.]MBI1417329.1 flagellar biosynthesis regulator FlaF [Limimaricola sp.]